MNGNKENLLLDLFNGGNLMWSTCGSYVVGLFNSITGHGGGYHEFISTFVEITTLLTAFQFNLEAEGKVLKHQTFIRDMMKVKNIS